MALYVLSDPHLSTHNEGKSMEAFGTRWKDYVSRMEKNWRALITDRDTVVLPGDISWAMTLEEASSDFAFLDALPGTKLLGKGNHDFYWTTATKMYRFFEENSWHSLRILYNNAYLIGNIAVCGTRGWFNDSRLQNTVGTVDYEKIVHRETLRLRMTLDAGRNLRTTDNTMPELVPFLHFPPVWADFRCEEFMQVLHEYGVTRCYFGHIHGSNLSSRPFVADGIRFLLCSADHLNFTPRLVESC